MEPIRSSGRSIADRVRHYRYVAVESFWSLRRGRPAVDHLVRAVERYSDQNGSQLAASVTYFAFLAFFPLVALAFSILGYVSFMHEEIRAYLDAAIQDLLPGLADELPMEEIERARLGAGALGFLGLLYTGLGSMWALRHALHTIWLKGVTDTPNFFVAKLLDTFAIAVLGLAMLGSVALTSVAQAATQWLLALAALDGSTAAAVLTRGLGLAAGVGADTLIFLLMFRHLSGTRRPWWLLWRGALLAAVGFEALKTAGALFVRGTLDNPVYASFAVLVGLLVWINLVARFLLFAAAWTATWLPMPYHPQAGESLERGAGPGGAEEEPAGAGAPNRWLADTRTRSLLAGLVGLGVTGYAVWRRRGGRRSA